MRTRVDPIAGRHNRSAWVPAICLLAAAAVVQAGDFTVVAAGLRGPESPTPLPDGSVLLVEMTGKSLTRVATDGTTRTIASFESAPTGVAIGPDGDAYVAVNAAANFEIVGNRSHWVGEKDPRGLSRVLRVDTDSGAQESLYVTTPATPFVAPNDLVFDGEGGFYLTDTGAHTSGDKTGVVYYARADGSSIQRIADVAIANGIVLSPDKRRLRVASENRIVEMEIESPGVLARDENGNVLQTVFARISEGIFDSMASLADGGILAGTLMPGALTHVSPQGDIVSQIIFEDENAVTSVGMGGADLQTAYVTLTESGRLVAVNSGQPGLRLAY